MHLMPREQEVLRRLELPEQLQVAALGDLTELDHVGEVGGSEPDRDRDHVQERQHQPGTEQPGRAEVQDRVEAHHLERVDLVGDPHRADLGHEPGADLGGHHVAERVRDHLAQVAQRGDRAGRGGRADRLGGVGALDPALQPEDEHQPEHDHRRAGDQDAGLAQRLADEPEHPAVEDLASRSCRRTGAASPKEVSAAEGSGQSDGSSRACSAPDGWPAASG